MHFKRNAIFENTGFMIKRLPSKEGKAPVFQFADLNPQQEFNKVFSRVEAFKIGLWFFFQSLSR